MISRAFGTTTGASQPVLGSAKPSPGNPYIARVVSPDIVVSDATSSQAWNRYSYVSNTPLNATDPSGLDPIQLPPLEVTAEPDPPPATGSNGGTGSWGSGSGSGSGSGGGSSDWDSGFADWASSWYALQNAMWMASFTARQFGFQPNYYATEYSPNRPTPAPQANLTPSHYFAPSPQIDGVSSGAAWSGNGLPASAVMAFTSDAYQYASGYVHAGLTVGSFAPSIFGSVVSAVDAGVYALEGDYVTAGTSLAAAGIGVFADAGLAKLALLGGSKLAAGLKVAGIGLAPKIAKIEKQLAQHGRASVEKSLRSLERRLAEHKESLEVYREQGGFTSSVEREIRAFEDEISAIKQVLERGQ